MGAGKEGREGEVMESVGDVHAQIECGRASMFRYVRMQDVCMEGVCMVRVCPEGIVVYMQLFVCMPGDCVGMGHVKTSELGLGS
eukprot:1651594-Rhodomonas_salina.1